jgi:hypothetical protein
VEVSAQYKGQAALFPGKRPVTDSKGGRVGFLK